MQASSWRQEGPWHPLRRVRGITVSGIRERYASLLGTVFRPFGTKAEERESWLHFSPIRIGILAVPRAIELFRDFSLNTTLVWRSETALGRGRPPHPIPLPKRGEGHRCD